MSNSRRLIAIIDDEESVRRALQRLLASSGFDVESFPNGADFFAFLKTRRPDCLVLDLHMPVMNGFEVLAQLIQGGDPIPVIAITGHDTAETRQRMVKLVHAAFLRKPVDDELLLESIRAVIAGEGPKADAP